MKSAVFYGKHNMRVEESPMPKVGAEDVLIQVKACGICGTDVHIYEGDKGAAEVTPPTILGHEFSGVVAEVGAAVTNVKVGDRVCIDPNCYCGKCDFCRNGIAHYCTDMIGYGTTVNGGFAEYCSVNQRQVYKLGDHTTFEQGAMTEPVACCLHGIDLCNIRPGSSVVVIGGGIIRWVLQNAGMGDIIGPALEKSGLPLILVAFLIAALIRSSVGAAVVAMTMAAGIMASMPAVQALSPVELAAMVCAINGGATAFSHVNDSGFWLVGSLLEIDEKSTLKSWTIMETIIGVVGLVCALVISIFA